MDTNASPETGSDRRWEILAFTSVGAFMAPLDGSILSVALPEISRDLSLSFEGTLWVQAAYMLTMAVLLIPLGRLADKRGRMRSYLIGIALFTLGSIGAALSMGLTSIVLARVLQACGGALLTSTSSAIVISAFPTAERGRALGINVMAVYGGLSIGPPLGGFLVSNLTWHWIFLMNIPIGITVLLWGRRLRQSISEIPTDHKLNVLSPALLGVAMIAMLLPLTLHSKWGLTSPIALALFAFSIISFALYFKVEKTATEPLIDLDLLRHNRGFALGNLAALLNYTALCAVALLTSVWLQLVQGLSAAHAGWLMLGQPLVQSLLSPIAGRLSDRIGTRSLTTAGMMLTAMGMLLLAYYGKGAGLIAIVVALVIMGVGMASFSAPNTSSVMGSVGRHQLSLASAFLGTMRSAGMTLSIAILGGLAAGHLGEGGWQALLELGPGGHGADAFITGYRTAMFTGAGFALLGVLTEVVNGATNKKKIS
jgi:EmrB/QacA subfamily drug resistance transporter